MAIVIMSTTIFIMMVMLRFKKNHPDHSMCWTRHGEDGFYSVVDAHNHFRCRKIQCLQIHHLFTPLAIRLTDPAPLVRPFGGPPVPWETYIGWLKSHGILFSTMLGIGQKLVPK